MRASVSYIKGNPINEFHNSVGASVWYKGKLFVVAVESYHSFNDKGEYIVDVVGGTGLRYLSGEARKSAARDMEILTALKGHVYSLNK